MRVKVFLLFQLLNVKNLSLAWANLWRTAKIKVTENGQRSVQLNLNTLKIKCTKKNKCMHLLIYKMWDKYTSGLICLCSYLCIDSPFYLLSHLIHYFHELICLFLCLFLYYLFAFLAIFFKENIYFCVFFRHYFMHV